MPRRASPETHPVAEWPEGPLVQGTPLEPVRYVERQLTRPDGTQVTVQVPVYPAFRLETWPPSEEEAQHLGARRPEPAAPAEVEEEGDVPDLEEDAA